MARNDPTLPRCTGRLATSCADRVWRGWCGWCGQSNQPAIQHQAAPGNQAPRPPADAAPGNVPGVHRVGRPPLACPLDSFLGASFDRSIGPNAQNRCLNPKAPPGLTQPLVPAQMRPPSRPYSVPSIPRSSGCRRSAAGNFAVSRPVAAAVEMQDQFRQPRLSASERGWLRHSTSRIHSLAPAFDGQLDPINPSQGQPETTAPSNAIEGKCTDEANRTRRRVFVPARRRHAALPPPSPHSSDLKQRGERDRSRPVWGAAHAFCQESECFQK